MKSFSRTCMIMLIALVWLAPLSARAEDPVGFIVSLKGTAHIERGRQSITASIKAPLLKGDTISTEAKSYIKILFNDDTIITVSEKSRFSIDQYLYDALHKQTQSLYRLFVGKLRVIVSRATLKVTTDTAIAGVRGTVFEISYDSATNTTTLNVFEGSIELKNIKPSVKGAQIVTAGQGSSVTGNEPPKPPAPLPARGKGGEAMLPAIEQPVAPVGTNEFVINTGQGTGAPKVTQAPPGYTKTGLHIVFP